ncbi:MAG TPA: redoxin domain-containing protein [Deltaproteobacteria bacterium]|nr:redoxin domain-containing protein [Deltaproteobacteria bacterium]HPR53900.1 redoxin domain-containing protein [Deltaproteobacteria bacterium]HXK46700.1 redoxin domain-containing protein [Deltaproteobacteria bacterium]
MCVILPATGIADVPREEIYQVGVLKPVDSTLKVKVGDAAPEFTLRAVSGGTVSLKDYIGKKNIMISFVPAAWTPVCSDQWPGYNLAREEFEQLDTVVIGISADNIPTLYAWTHTMGTLWFPVLSDFWPHGKTAEAYGVLRTDGTAERAIFIIDKKGIIRTIDVHDINKRPPLEGIMGELEKLNR